MHQMPVHETSILVGGSQMLNNLLIIIMVIAMVGLIGSGFMLLHHTHQQQLICHEQLMEAYGQVSMWKRMAMSPSRPFEEESH
jgi:hypothetical protein